MLVCFLLFFREELIISVRLGSDIRIESIDSDISYMQISEVRLCPTNISSFVF